MSSKLILKIFSYTVSKFARFFETQCSSCHSSCCSSCRLVVVVVVSVECREVRTVNVATCMLAEFSCSCFVVVVSKCVETQCSSCNSCCSSCSSCCCCVSGMPGGEENGQRGYMLTYVIAYLRVRILYTVAMAVSN